MATAHQRADVESPWQESALSAALRELTNAVAKLDGRTEAAAIESDVAEAIRRWLVNGRIVCIGYKFQIREDAWCGDVDAIIAGTAPEGCSARGQEVVVICEATSNVTKKMSIAVRRVSQNVRRWIDMCRIREETKDTELEFWPDDRTDIRLQNDLEKLEVNMYCAYQVVPAIGGSNLSAETGDAICERIRCPVDGLGHVSHSRRPCPFCLVVSADGHSVSAHAV